MNEFPSASRMREPFAFLINRGWPPTDRKARTGLFTPPGMTFWASANNVWEVFVFIEAHDVEKEAHCIT